MLWNGVTAQNPGSVSANWHRWLEDLRTREPQLFAASRTAKQDGKSAANSFAKESYAIERVTHYGDRLYRVRLRDRRGTELSAARSGAVRLAAALKAPR